MGTKAKPKQRAASQGSWRRRTWGMRMAAWWALALALVALIAYIVLRGDGDGGGDGSASRFRPIHTFDTPDYHSLAFEPSNPQVVFFGHHNGLQKSEDGGQSWETVVEEANWDAMNTVFDPFSAGTIYVAGHDVFFKSTDGGSTWEALRPNLPSLDLHTFTVSPSKEGRLYAIPAGQGLYISDDAGLQWQLLSDDVPTGSNSVLELPGGTLLLGATDQGILRSEDGGQTWLPVRAGITPEVFALKASGDGTRLYAGTNAGVFASEDQGRTWTGTALDDTWIIGLAVEPADPQSVLALDRGGNLYRSKDGGQTW